MTTKRLWGDHKTWLKMYQMENGYQFVSRKQVPVPDGNDKVDAVVVIAHDTTGRLLIIKEHRPVAGGYIWALPAGLVDDGETIFEAAMREIKEETGLDLIVLEDEYRVNNFSSPGLTDEKVAIVCGYVYGEISTDKQEPGEDIQPFLMSPDDMMCCGLDDPNINMSIWLAMLLM